MTKYFTKQEFDELLTYVDAKPGDLILFCADSLAVVRRTLGQLRLDLGDMLELRDKKEFRFLFVVDFPEFEYSEEEGRFMAMHHPFTMPYPEDIPYLLSDPARVRAQAYDVVLNGVELGSGSIRIHRQDIQKSMFKALGFSPAEIETRFGFMVNAFRYGTPPHGGFAFGLDRLVMLLLGADSLREVIAFPKVRDASCPMTEAPGLVDEEQLKVLSLGSGEKRARIRTEAARTGGIDVEKTAHLARLSLNEREREELSAQMYSIIGFANQLSAIDTSDAEQADLTLGVSNVMRADVPGETLAKAEVLAEAPMQADGCIRVPRTFE